jgi:hypothetical protein
MLFYKLASLEILNEESPCNEAYADLHGVKVVFRFGLQTVLSLVGLY